jgi:hypothetical protein
MADLVQQYRKALKVVDSCRRPEHFDAARRYVNLFFQQNSIVNRRGIRLADKGTHDLYKKLELKLWINAKRFYSRPEFSNLG